MNFKGHFDRERLNNLPIVEVAKKLGLTLRNNKCHCFIHEEKTPSFSILPAQNIWKCFGCSEGGGVIKLVQKYNGCSFIDACKWLSNEFGLASFYLVKSNVIHKKIINKFDKLNKPNKPNKPNPFVYKWVFDNLTVTENVKEFIKTRCYSNSVIDSYNLKGIDDCESFFNRCKSEWGIDIMLQCGLAKEYVDEGTGEINYKFTWWTNTLLFPFFDNAGNIVYIQGRTLNTRFEKKFKYVNLNGVATIPFNLPVIEGLHEGDELLITEGVTDCISSCLMGKSAVGIIGASGFKKEYVDLFKHLSINVIPDNDMNKTGERFADSIRKEFAAVGKTINVYYLDANYKDISDYYMKK